MQWTTRRPGRHLPAATSRGPLRRVGLVLAVGAVVAIVAGVSARTASRAESSEPIPAAATDPVGRADSGHWRFVLERLATERARAWRTAHPAALRRVFYPGSSALRADRRMLSAYLARDLRPRGVRLHFASVEMTHSSERRVTLSVVDVLGPAWVRAADGTVTDLPRDQPTAHTLVLRRVGSRWLIASVRTQ